MESQNLDEQMEWEAQRVAAAYEVENFYGPGSYWGEVRQMKIEMYWEIEEHTNRILCIHCREIDAEDGCAINWNEEAGWWLEPHPQFHEFMARGLYRLGIEDEDILSQLNHPLTAHEKLELRLSLPREFWPQKWLEEEGNSATNPIPKQPT